jgi:hypothetical protein
VALPGLSGVNPDEEIARMEQIARDGLRPPIIGLQSVAVRLASGNIAIVLHIPKSWNPPHQVTYQKAFRFYGRDTNSKYQLDVDELRSIFSLSEGVADKTRLFRVDRVAKIAAGEAPAVLRAGAKMITHILPLSAFTTIQTMDLNPLWRDPTLLLRVANQGGSVRFNMDGVLQDSSSNERPSYAQVYRNGCIEAVHCVSEESAKRTSLPSAWFEGNVVFSISGSMQILQGGGIQPPIVVLVTMLGMKGWRMGVPPDQSSGSYGALDRDPLFFPEIVIDTFGGDVAAKAKPLIDIVWNAAGWPASLNYDQTGKWTVR